MTLRDVWIEQVANDTIHEMLVVRVQRELPELTLRQYWKAWRAPWLRSSLGVTVNAWELRHLLVDEEYPLMAICRYVAGRLNTMAGRHRMAKAIVEPVTSTVSGYGDRITVSTSVRYKYLPVKSP